MHVRTLKQCLLDCDLAMLRAIAERWGIELATNRHHDAAAELAARMTAPSAQVEQLACFIPAEREALAALLAAEGQMPVGAFTRHFGEIRLMGPGRLERERPWDSPQGVAESLWYAGLIYRAFDEGPGSIQEVIYVPPELRSGLQTMIAPQSTEIAPLPVLPIDSPIEPRPGCFNDDVCTVLAYAHQSALLPAPCDEAWQRRQPLLAEQLGEATRAFIELLLHLAERVGLLRLGEQRLRPNPDQAIGWLRACSFEQLRTVFKAWRDDATWNELWHVPGLRCEDTGSWQNDPLIARQTLLDYLALAQTGQWHSLDGLINTIKAQRPDFQRPGGDYDGWYIRDAQTGDYLRGFASWDKVDGALLRYLLAAPLTWLDVVQLSGSQTPIAFRLTESGAALLGKGEPPKERGDGRFEVDANGTVRVGSARRYERFQLSRVADWLGKENDGRSLIYQIRPSSLQRARYQRIGVERVIRFLEESAAAPVPDILLQALRRWRDHGSEAWADQVVMLRVVRPELLEQLMSTPATRRLIREPIASTVAAVLPQHWPALRQELLAMGILVDQEARQL